MIKINLLILDVVKMLEKYTILSDIGLIVNGRTQGLDLGFARSAF